MLEGTVDNGEPFNKNEIDFLRVEKRGIIFTKPFSLRLCVCNVYLQVLPDDNTDDVPIPAKILFYEDHCVICTAYKPNILYASCGHVCICRSCDGLYPFNRCPLCRKSTDNKFYLLRY